MLFQNCPAKYKGKTFSIHGKGNQKRSSVLYIAQAFDIYMCVFHLLMHDNTRTSGTESTNTSGIGKHS